MKNKLPIIILSIALLISVGGNVYLIVNQSALNNQITDAVNLLTDANVKISDIENQLTDANNQITDLESQRSDYEDLQNQYDYLNQLLVQSNEKIEALESSIVTVGNGTGDYVPIETEEDQLMEDYIASQEEAKQQSDFTGTGAGTGAGTGTQASGGSATTSQPPQLSAEEKAEMEAAGFGTSNDSLQGLLNNGKVLDHSTAEATGSDIGVGVKLK